MRYLMLLLCFAATPCFAEAKELQTGAQQLVTQPDISPVELKAKQIALVVNQSSIVGDTHLLELLLQQDLTVKTVFSPEHGFRGTADAGAKVDNSIDPDTGVAVLSLYGKNKKPKAQALKGIDLLIFDLQDVGVRYYTYLSTLHYVMEAAAAQNIPLLVLDRPNPNGAYVDGPVLDKDYQSFVGMHPIPLLHGMTLGELALMIKGEGWINKAEQLKLYVLPVKNYQRDMPYDLPVRPSPNLPNAQAVALYPSLGFFEATPLSIGRGTDFPFQVLGYTNPPLGNFAFSPVAKAGAALNPPLKNQLVLGLDLRSVKAGGLDLSYLIQAQRLFAKHQLKLFNSPDFMDKLSGSHKLRQQIEQGWSEAQIRQSWQSELIKFRQQRQPYLLYPDHQL
ncbi:exo-beta-N-acetylmuramidase NamZ family protein [Rheinheimera faecalis]